MRKSQGETGRVPSVIIIFLMIPFWNLGYLWHSKQNSRKSTSSLRVARSRLRLKPLQTCITIIYISLNSQSHYMHIPCTSFIKTLLHAASQRRITGTSVEATSNPRRQTGSSNLFITWKGEKGERKWSEPPHTQWMFLHTLKQNFTSNITHNIHLMSS